MEDKSEKKNARTFPNIISKFSILIKILISGAERPVRGGGDALRWVGSSLSLCDGRTYGWERDDCRIPGRHRYTPCGAPMSAGLRPSEVKFSHR